MVALGAGAIGWLGSGRQLGVGDRTPATWRGADRTSPVVAWVFRGKDCLSCFTPAYDLRRLRGTYGDRLGLWTVAVQDPDSLARQFLRRERIGTVHRSLDTDEFRETFGRTALPALFLSHRDTIRGVWRPRGDETPGGTGSTRALRAMVAHLMAASKSRD